MRSRSGSLLKSLIESEQVATDDIARRLGVSSQEIDAYACGELVMPLPLQLLLADLVIEKMPLHARRAHSLRAQAEAATAFQQHETSVHSEPPGKWWSRLS